MGELARRLSAIDLVDDEGHGVRLGDAWAERPALLVFIRHFG